MLLYDSLAVSKGILDNDQLPQESLGPLSKTVLRVHLCKPCERTAALYMLLPIFVHICPCTHVHTCSEQAHQHKCQSSISSFGYEEPSSLVY